MSFDQYMRECDIAFERYQYSLSSGWLSSDQNKAFKVTFAAADLQQL